MANPDKRGSLKNSSSFDAVAVGYSAIDFLGVVPHYPVENLKLELEEFEIQGGGPAATAMATVSRLGLRAAYMGVMGDDIFGVRALRELTSENVDTSSVVIKKGGKSQFAFIMVNKKTGKRTILWSRGDLPNMKGEWINPKMISSSKALLIDTLEPVAALRAARIARESGVPVLIDAGTLRDGVEELLPLCDYIVASEVFASQISDSESADRALDILFSYGPREAVVTLGERGCAAVDRDGSLRFEGFEVESVDTTGAGDVFHGAYLYAVLQGWDITRKCVFSNAVAALKCGKLGGRAGIPNIGEVHKFLRRRRRELHF